jgi:hypothetical protein
MNARIDVVRHESAITADILRKVSSRLVLASVFSHRSKRTPVSWTDDHRSLSAVNRIRGKTLMTADFTIRLSIDPLHYASFSVLLCIKTEKHATFPIVFARRNRVGRPCEK